jgi:SRSO17 transposase
MPRPSTRVGLALLLGDPAAAPHADGVLVIDDTGDRKAGTHTAHVARQWLGSIGKVDNGIVAVSSLWADERVYYLLHLRPYTPSSRLALDPAFQTKPQLALELIEAARTAGVPFRAVVADCAYGDNVTFEAGLWAADLPYVVGLKPSGPGQRLAQPTPLRTRPDNSVGPGRPTPAIGPRSSGAFGTATARRGGQPT